MSWGSTTDYASAVAYLYRHIGRGVKPGLERIAGLLELLANPERSYPIVHLAGTNGKTSTARMVAALLSAHGLTPGVFTSPHLQAVEERFSLGLDAMTPDEFALVVAELAPLVDLYEERSGDGITYFELTAALAFSWFAERAVDAAVVETGLGGRFDATNVASSEVAVLTSIGIEHVEYLGHTVEEIAGEKLAILDEGSFLVTGALPPSVVAMAEAAAKERNAHWFSQDTDFRISAAQPAVGGWLIDIEGAEAGYHDLHLTLHGRHQTANFAVAVAAVEALLGRPLDVEAVREAAAAVTAPGRMEIVRRDPLLMLDGAHNPHGAAALCEAIAEEFPTLQWRLVIGAMQDKDLDGILDPFRGCLIGVETAAADIERATDAGDVAADATRVLGVPATPHPDVPTAVAAAAESGDPVLVTGSIYVVGEARTALGI